jgi:hypothetical protein
MAVADPRTETPSRRSRWTRIRRLLRYFAGPAQSARACTPAPATVTPVVGLDECVVCRRDMVCPIHWHAVDDERWAIALRCGECGFECDVVASNAQAADFDIALDRQQQTMERELVRLDAERMAEEVDAFIDALDRDGIGPADFAR